MLTHFKEPYAMQIDYSLRAWTDTTPDMPLYDRPVGMWRVTTPSGLAGWVRKGSGRALARSLRRSQPITDTGDPNCHVFLDVTVPAADALFLAVRPDLHPTGKAICPDARTEQVCVRHIKLGCMVFARHAHSSALHRTRQWTAQDLFSHVVEAFSPQAQAAEESFRELLHGGLLTRVPEHLWDTQRSLCIYAPDFTGDAPSNTGSSWVHRVWTAEAPAVYVYPKPQGGSEVRTYISCQLPSIISAHAKARMILMAQQWEQTHPMAPHMSNTTGP